jgi:hypothetical protein
MCAGRNVEKMMIKPELTARVLLHILLEGPGFVAAAGGLLIRKSRNGSAR